jgi:DNA repair protein RadC
MCPPSLTNSRRAYDHLKGRFHSKQEEFWAVALNSELEVLATELIFRGTVNFCPLHPRELFRFLFLHQASSFLVAHNHPTGSSLPSRSDLTVTRQLWKLSRLVQIPLNDHLILGRDGYTSLADRGFFQKLK